MLHSFIIFSFGHWARYCCIGSKFHPTSLCPLITQIPWHIRKCKLYFGQAKTYSFLLVYHDLWWDFSWLYNNTLKIKFIKICSNLRNSYLHFGVFCPSISQKARELQPDLMQATYNLVMVIFANWTNVGFLPYKILA